MICGLGIAAVATGMALAGDVRTSRATAQSQLTLISLPNPSQPESPFTLIATVSGGGPAPTGTVTFFSNLCAQPCAAPTGPIGTATLDGHGRAIFGVGFRFRPGSYAFGATYNGDSNYGQSSDGLLQVVAVEAASPIPTLEGRALVLMALLLAAAGSFFLWKGNG